MIHLLSYPICENQPGWPENPKLSVTQESAIKNGDSANTYTIHLFNHFGTHFDAPRHFNEAGSRISELPFCTFFYKQPLLLDIPKGAGMKIMPEDLKPYEEKIMASDLLMLRTGFSQMRQDDPKAYSYNGPAISSAAANYLIEQFPNLKAIALDFISLASYSDPLDGNLAHEYLLGRFHDHFICIIEDVNLTDLPKKLKRVCAIPLLIEEIDSAPVTMWAEY